MNQTTIEDLEEPRRQDRHPQGLALQPALEGEDPLPAGAGRNGHLPGGGGRRTGSRPRSSIASGTPGRSRRSSSRATCAATRARRAASSSRSPTSARSRRRPTTRSRCRSTGPTSSSRTATSGSAASGQPRRCASATRSSRRSASSSTGSGFRCVDAPIFTPTACEGTTTLFEVNYFDEEKAYLTQIRPALHGGGRDGARQGLLLRPRLPRREEQDAQAPDRVLDARAGDGLRDARGRDGRRRGAPLAIVAPACSSERRRTSRRSSGTSRGSSEVARALPAHHLRRGGRDPRGEGPGSSTATTSARPTRRRSASTSTSP